MPTTFSRLGGWPLLTLLTLVSFGASAQQRPTRPSAPQRTREDARAGRPLADVLTPDGRLRPGAKGSFDPTGYRMGTNPVTGQPTFRTAGAGDEDWQATTGARINGTVYALAVAPNGDVYAGGNFSDAGGNPNADGIFRWDGASLQSLGTGLNGGVEALAVGPNGDVYVGGQFTDAGGNPAADNIARWDGTSWQALGTGVDSRVYDLTIHNNSVYVVGQFGSAGGTPNTYAVAQWDGSNWQSLGGGLNFGGFLGSVAVTANGDVYVGGYFNNANGDPSLDMIARFNGSNWQGVGFGLSSTVDALTIAANGDVVAAGLFSNAGGNPDADRIAHWNGSSWQAYGTGIRGQVYTLLGASNGDVYAAGFFVDATNTISQYTMRWDGTSWQGLSPDLGSYSYAVAEAPNGDIWYGGDFQKAGTALTPFKIARWNGTSWFNPATVGVNGRVNALAVAANGDVYVGGNFTDAGNNPDADYVARWDGDSWEALGNGLNNQVFALAVAASGDVYAGGPFSNAGGNPAANNLARWDGTSWQAVGTGFAGYVGALAMAANGDLYVGGNFNNAGGNPNADKIARWDGTSFQALGTGLNGQVNALAVAANGDLWVGGSFEDAGGNPDADFVARWNGTSFQALGTGLNNQVNALAVAGTGQVWIGGQFENAGGNPDADGVARWDGTSFQALGTGVPGPVNALAAMGTGQVNVGGNFTEAGGNPNADYVARWNGTSWQALGTGLNDEVKALAAGTAGQLYAGGDFTAVGDGSKLLNRFGIHYAPSLIVSSPQHVPAGAYHNITITGTGDATLDGDITISGTLLMEDSSILRTGNGASCATISGPGEFYMSYDTELHICSPDGLTYDNIGNIQVTGYRYFEYAKYVYDGTVPQVTGNALEYIVELEIANPAGVTLSQGSYVYEVLRLTNGTLNTGGEELVLASYQQYTAYALHAGGAVNGNVTVQRYVSGPSGLGYRHLSSPVQSAPVADLTTSGYTPIVNAAYNNLPYKAPKAAQFPNILGFNETRGGTTPAYAGFTTGYYSPTALTSILTPGRGWSVYMAGDLTPDFVGVLTTGNVAMPLTVTGTNPSPNTLKAGWHLLGNPYAQPIDWDLATVPAGMSSSISVYRTTGGNNGVYLTRANGVGSLPDGVVALGQGFFARATAPTTFTFTNAMRVEVELTTVARPAAETRPMVRLTLAAATPGAEAVETLLYAQAGATLGEDASYDGLRPDRNVGVPTLASVIAGQEAAVNALPETVLTQATVVELTAVLPEAGTYALGVGELINWNATPVALLDRLTNTRYDLSKLPTMTFTVAQAGEVRGRFAVVTGNAGQASPNLGVWPNPANATVQISLPAGATQVELLDATGRVVRHQSAAGEARFDLTGLPAGVYIVRAAGLTQRLVVE